MRSAIATASSSSASRSTRMPNSSPPKRATMSPGRRWARSRGATARSSSSPAWWPMLSLISLKLSRSRKRIPTGEPETVLRLSESPSESTKLSRFGKPVSGIVQNPVAQRLIRSVALDRVGEHVGRSLDEVHVLRGEAVGLGGVDVEHAEGLLRAVDQHGEAAAHAHHSQRRRHREAPLGRPVVDDHVQTRVERGAGVRVARGRGAGGADDAILEPGAQAEPAAVATDLPDAGRLDPLDLGHQRDRLAHQLDRSRRPSAPARRDGRLPPAGRRRAAAPARRSCAR